MVSALAFSLGLALSVLGFCFALAAFWIIRTQTERARLMLGSALCLGITSILVRAVSALFNV